MRWDELFADLEAQADRIEVSERSAEVGGLARAEFAQVGLTDRMRPSVGGTVLVRCLGAAQLTGRLDRVGPDWLLLVDEHDREAVVALDAVLSVAGLVRLTFGAGSAGRVEGALGLRSALRGVARDRSAVRIHLTDGSVNVGTIDRVGADFLELATHPGAELRRRGEVRDVLAVPLSAVVAVRREL
jgi:hypothetical protein